MSKLLILLLGSSFLFAHSGYGLASEFKRLPGRYISGHELRTPVQDKTLKRIRLSACEKACSLDKRCKAYTYNSNSESCFLKSSVGAIVPFAGVISGTRTTRSSVGKPTQRGETVPKDENNAAAALSKKSFGGNIGVAVSRNEAGWKTQSIRENETVTVGEGADMGANTERLHSVGAGQSTDVVGGEAEAIVDGSMAIGNLSGATDDTWTGIGDGEIEVGNSSDAVGGNSTAIGRDASALPTVQTDAVASATKIGMLSAVQKKPSSLSVPTQQETRTKQVATTDKRPAAKQVNTQTAAIRTIGGNVLSLKREEIWRMRRSMTESEPKGAWVLDYGARRFFVKNSVTDIGRLFGGRIRFAEFKAPNGKPVYIAVDRIDEIKKSDAGQHHPKTRCIISTDHGSQQVQESKALAVKVVATARSAKQASRPPK